MQYIVHNVPYYVTFSNPPGLSIFLTESSRSIVLIFMSLTDPLKYSLLNVEVLYFFVPVTEIIAK